PLPGREPALDRLGTEFGRRGGRPSLRSVAGNGLIAAAPEMSLRATGRVRRRKLVNRVMEGVGTGAAVLAIGVLALVVTSVAVKAGPALSLHLFTRAPSLFGGQGGISSAIVGSALILAMATGMAVPIGVLTAIFLVEFSPRWIAAPIQLVLDMLNGMPTIVTG